MEPWPIAQVAERLGLGPADWEPRGWFAAKLTHGLAERLADRPRGRYVNVTAITPTPRGEGKTVVTIGLADALARLGHRAVPVLRQPSLAPVFGVKGGGAGGGRATLLPAEEINLHFTGDLHATAAAHNLLTALVENHAARELPPRVDPAAIVWRRVTDTEDKGLAQIVTGLGRFPQAPVRETGFDLTAASEVMAILALAEDLADLRARLGRIVVALPPDGPPIVADDVHGAGAMAALLRDALRPNLVQTAEHVPALVHAGPFANIAHGNSSVAADRIALHLADFVVTESGFGADCGAEKFVDVKCRASGLAPDATVLVCTVRALKYHGGHAAVRPGRALPESLGHEDLPALRRGAENLQAHLDLLRWFGVPVVVAVNRFPEDTQRELDETLALALSGGAAGAEVVDVFSRGGEGGLALAEAVVAAARSPSEFRFLYPAEASPAEKIERIATRIYGADGVDFEPRAARQIAEIERHGWGRLPVCVAKTPFSLSHDPLRLGRPRGFRVPIRAVHVSAGAGFLYALAGDIVTLPGLPEIPAAVRIDLAPDGRIVGLT